MLDVLYFAANFPFPFKGYLVQFVLDFFIW